MAAITTEVEVDLDADQLSEAIAQLDDNEAADLYEQLQEGMPDNVYRDDLLDRIGSLDKDKFIEMFRDVIDRRDDKELDLALWEFLMARVEVKKCANC